MTREITINDPEFDDIFDAVLYELALNKNAVEERRSVSEESFREWIYQRFVDIARKLGFIINNVSEFGKDMIYGLKKGYAAGREEARRKSIRAKEDRKSVV